MLLFKCPFPGPNQLKEQNGVMLQDHETASAIHSFVRLECLPLGFCKLMLELFVLKGVDFEIIHASSGLWNFHFHAPELNLPHILIVCLV